MTRNRLPSSAWLGLFFFLTLHNTTNDTPIFMETQTPNSTSGEHPKECSAFTWAPIWLEWRGKTGPWACDSKYGVSEIPEAQMRKKYLDSIYPDREHRIIQLSFSVLPNTQAMPEHAPDDATKSKP